MQPLSRDVILLLADVGQVLPPPLPIFPVMGQYNETVKPTDSVVDDSNNHTDENQDLD